MRRSNIITSIHATNIHTRVTNYQNESLFLLARLNFKTKLKELVAHWREIQTVFKSFVDLVMIGCIVLLECVVQGSIPGCWCERLAILPSCVLCRMQEGRTNDGVTPVILTSFHALKDVNKGCVSFISVY